MAFLGPDERDREQFQQTILFPVRDDAWAPHVRKGELAIVSITQCELVEGVLFLRRGSRGNLNLVQLRKHDNRGHAKIPDHRPGDVYWHMCFGFRGLFTLDGRGGRYRSCDGPLADVHMREEILGKVVGVAASSSSNALT